LNKQLKFINNRKPGSR